MADNIDFKVRTQSVTYGDDKTFLEYRILMSHKARLVGYEEGPRRETLLRVDALRAARKRIRELASHKLFVIPVTRKCITDGEARNCNTCAISQALWRNQERMEFPKREFSFEVSPYAFGVEPRGIVLSRRWGDEGDRHIPVDDLPDLVNGLRRRRVLNESMEEWAMLFDDWAESRYMSLSDWREMRGYDDGERPWRPGPASFVLDLDAFRPLEE